MMCHFLGGLCKHSKKIVWSSLLVPGFLFLRPLRCLASSVWLEQSPIRLDIKRLSVMISELTSISVFSKRLAVKSTFELKRFYCGPMPKTMSCIKVLRR